MRTIIRTLLFFLAFLVPSIGQKSSSDETGQRTNPLDIRIPDFEVTDGVFRDGISELSLKKIDGLHLGFEEIIRKDVRQDPRAVSPHFNLHLAGKTVREILDALCTTDSGYEWSQDGLTTNIYPRSAVRDPSYLLNQPIEQLSLTSVPDPYEALTPLAKLFPQQQIGYAGTGANAAYAKPWTTVFEHVTVRQFVNRILERVGPQTTWVWQGGENERMFAFLKDGFNSTGPGERK